MRFPAAETAERHERLLSEAARMFRTRGIEAVTVAEVMKAAGMTHGAFYSHFGTKDDLVAVAVERALEEMLVAVDALAASSDPRKDLVARYMTKAHRDSPGQGCAMAALAQEAGRRPGLMQKTFTKRVDLLMDRLARLLGRRRTKTRAEAIATFACLVGGLTLARAVDDPAFSDEILRAVRLHFDVDPKDSDDVATPPTA